MRAFVGKPWKAEYEPTNKIVDVVNSVEIGGSEKYLVVRWCSLRFLCPVFDLSIQKLQEFGSKYEPETLRNSKKLEVDVMIYVYDSSDTNSFSYISNLRVSS